MKFFAFDYKKYLAEAVNGWNMYDCEVEYERMVRKIEIRCW